MTVKKSKKKLRKQWSVKDEDAEIGFWNPWAYSNERHEYCKSLDLDILGLGELHNIQGKDHFQEKRWICSQGAEEKDGKSTDPAAGVAILLSARMAKRIMSSGCVGTRIVWVRIEGPICNLFVVVVYIPHKGRTNPSAQDTIKQLMELLSTVRRYDCIILMGDFNCQLRRNVPGCTGQWCMTTRPDNGHGEEMLDLMRRHDLFAADTLFKPKRKRWGNKKKLRTCNATYLAKDEGRRPRKLDYICVSNRWKSMMISAKTKWGPSIHRFGQKFDHGLLSAKWRWRNKKTEKQKRFDYSEMDSQLWSSFDNNLRIRLQEKYVTRGPEEGHNGHDKDPVTEIKCVGRRFRRLAECVQGAIEETVPEKKKMMRNGREVSAKTKELYKKRERAFAKKKPSTNERKEWNKKINRACRDDYRAWVSRWTSAIEEANRRGDTKEVYRGVKAVSGTNNKFVTKQPTMKNGKQISEPEELANVWNEFLQKKFSPTKLEALRKELEKL